MTHDLEEAIALSDRIVVLSGRPARVALDVPVELPRPRDAIAIRQDPAFRSLFARLCRRSSWPGAVVFFLVFSNTYSGVRNADPDLIDVVHLMGGRRLAVMRFVLVPSALAWIFTGLKIAVPYALVGAVVGEMGPAQRCSESNRDQQLRRGCATLMSQSIE